MPTVFNIGSRARLIGRYALSAALVAIAGGLTLLISSSFLTAPMRFFFAAVVASAWWGGIGPAGFAIILSSLLVNYLFKPPLSFLFEFLAFSVIASWITYRGKRAEDALKRAHDQLEMRVEQRTAELTQTNELLLAEMAERRRAEDAYQQAQSALAHVTRVMTMGEMTASIAHEVNQPLSGVVINGNACLRWLAGNPPNLDEAREAVQRIIRDGKRASEVIARIRALARKTSTEMEKVNINEAIEEVVALAQGEARRQGVTIHMELESDLSLVLGDRVQLQQVMLNLIMNAVEAMRSNGDRPRELHIKTQDGEINLVQVALQDTGSGLDPQNTEKIFDAFYTTKPAGLGMGLSISRSIVENHGGKLWATPNEGPGATFQFNVLKYR